MGWNLFTGELVNFTQYTNFKINLRIKIDESFSAMLKIFLYKSITSCNQSL